MHSSQVHACFASHAVLERYKSQNLQRVCNFEANKAQIKKRNSFLMFFLFYLIKEQKDQNTTNRMCIKRRNSQCFLSMSLKVFNTTLGKVGPGEGLPYMYM